MKYYEENKEKARELIRDQIKDGWSFQDAKDYWYSLGYDIFFVNSVVKPCFHDNE